MKKFAYMIILREFKPGPDYEGDLEAFLNEWGMKGWKFHMVSGPTFVFEKEIK